MGVILKIRKFQNNLKNGCFGAMSGVDVKAEKSYLYFISYCYPNHPPIF